MPRIPVVPSELPEQISRMAAMHSARKEMAAAIAKERLSSAIRANVPAAAMKDIKIGSDVLVYREKPEDMWIGPFKVLDSDGKLLRLDVRGSVMQVYVDKVKLYLSPQNNPRLESTKRASQLGIESSDPQSDAQVARSTNSDIIGELEDILSGLRDRELKISTVNLVGAPHPQRESIFPAFADDNPKNSSYTAHEHLTEILEADDPRANSKMFNIAKDVEVKGLLKRKTWRVIPKTQLPTGANVLSGRFVLTLKNVGSDTQRAKARFVAQGHRDKEKRVMVDNFTSLRQSSTRLIISIAAVKGFRIFAHDVNQAYLQSEEELTRQLFLLPKKRDLKFFKLDEKDILHLLKPIYGTTDAGDYWGVTMDRNAGEELQS